MVAEVEVEDEEEAARWGDRKRRLEITNGVLGWCRTNTSRQL